MNSRLLVPGTSGCKLLHDGKDVGWPSELTVAAWIGGSRSPFAKLASLALGTSAAKIVDLLSMEYGDPGSPAPVRSTLAGGNVTPGDLLRLVYSQLGDYEPFPYDWRGDIRESAAKLVDHLETRAPGDPKWRIVSHSQGGLVVVAASKLYARRHGDDDRAFSKIVSHVVLLAVPLHGTVAAAEALIVGDELGSGFADAFKKVARTWPALHQMLPAWPGCIRRIGADGEEVAVPGNLMDEAPWAGHLVDPAMLERARLTRSDLLRAPLSRMNGVAVKVIRTNTLPTRDHVLLTGGGLTVPPPTATGDGLVPEKATYEMGGEVERVRSHAFGGGRGKALPHNMLANDPVIATEIETFMKPRR
jgi:hypothetical protein